MVTYLFCQDNYLIKRYPMNKRTCYADLEEEWYTVGATNLLSETIASRLYFGHKGRYRASYRRPYRCRLRGDVVSSL